MQPPPVTDTNNLSVLDHLRCPLCFDILDQPLELICNAFICAKCLKAWLVESADVQCPCCYNHKPLAPSHFKAASNLVLDLLGDVVVHCVLCSRDMKASSYQGHTCELPPTQEEMRSAAQILRRAASLSPEQPVVKICVYTCIYKTALGYTLCYLFSCITALDICTSYQWAKSHNILLH